VKLLLDTVAFLDAALLPAKDIPKRARVLLLDPDNDLYVSIASYWEISIKYSIGKLSLPEAPERLLPTHREKIGAELLAIDEESTFHLTRLPPVHNDPFDRLLICQAIVHGMVLLTPDARISRYPVRTAW
jgi:PIN domain nuclease of toxin-antitoxin system